MMSIEALTTVLILSFQVPSGQLEAEKRLLYSHRVYLLKQLDKGSIGYLMYY